MKKTTLIFSLTSIYIKFSAMTTPRLNIKKKIDASVLFSKQRETRKEPAGAHVLAPESSDDEEADSKIEDSSLVLRPQKLSFASDSSSINSSREISANFSKGLETRLLEEYEEDDYEEESQTKSFLGKHEVILQPSSESDDEEKENKKKKAKTPRKRIIAFASSSESDSEDNGQVAKTVTPNASFDLGAIKRQFTSTKKPARSRRDKSSDSDDYDLEDSFINDDSESDCDPVDITCDLDKEDVVTEAEDESATDSDEEPSEIEEEVKEKKPSGRPIVKTVKEDSLVTTETLLASLSHDFVKSKTHPLARKYVEHFNKNKEELADFLFKLYNSEIFDNCLPHDTKLKWSKTLQKTAGRCACKKKMNSDKSWDRFCEIELAVKVLTSGDRLRDTLIHEMCHAAAWILSGYSDGHGPLFKSWGQRAVNVFPDLPMITRCHNYSIESKFAYICKDCGHHFKRHSKSLDTEKYRCASRACKSKLNAKPDQGKLILHVMDKKTKKYVPCKSADSSNKASNPFADFVKENYKDFRTPGTTHANAMKELSKKFASQKLSQ